MRGILRTAAETEIADGLVVDLRVCCTAPSYARRQPSCAGSKLINPQDHKLTRPGKDRSPSHPALHGMDVPSLDASNVSSDDVTIVLNSPGALRHSLWSPMNGKTAFASSPKWRRGGGVR